MIVDYKDNEFIITSQIIQNEKETKEYITKGKTIEECISKISNKLNKEIFISHMKVLLLTENVIKNNINYQDYFLRNAKSKMNYYVYYIDEENKNKIFKSNNKSTSLYLKDLTDFNTKNYSSTLKLSFLDLVYKTNNKGIEPIYPKIIINNNELSTDGLIAFKDNKIIELNNDETIYYNILTNNIKNTTINIPCDNNYFTLEINNLKTKYKWNNSFNFNIQINSKITNYSCKYKLDDPNTIKRISKLTENHISNKSKEIVNKCVNNNYDFLGIKNYIYKHDKKWDNELNKIDINIKTDSIITSIGEMRK